MRGAEAAPLSKAASSRAAGIAARQHQSHREQRSTDTSADLRIAFGQAGARRRAAQPAGQGRAPDGPATMLRQRDRLPPVRSSCFGNRAMREAAVALQPARRIDAARPGESCKTIIQRQGGGGDGGGQQQRLQRPGNKGEEAGQRQREIKADEADSRPERRQKLSRWPGSPAPARYGASARGRRNGSAGKPVWDTVLGDEIGIALPGPYDAPLLAREPRLPAPAAGHCKSTAITAP